ncbi:hypothetical protein [Rhizobium leguminosarum]|jgi:hypothetical protein|uniref:hypothetical protein n=1 Tax=Rhizobium leguminosarum TaxID=384 RepID=UPI002E10AD39|nr:hypothetical protein U8Q02_38640 [Rhizobium leguminosarum]
MRPHVAIPSNGFLGRAIAVFSAASAASARIDVRRHPQASDLMRLGIDPSSFPNVTRV